MPYNQQLVALTYKLVCVARASNRYGKVIVKKEYCIVQETLLPCIFFTLITCPLKEDDMHQNKVYIHIDLIELLKQKLLYLQLNIAGVSNGPMDTIICSNGLALNTRENIIWSNVHQFNSSVTKPKWTEFQCVKPVYYTYRYKVPSAGPVYIWVPVFVTIVPADALASHSARPPTGTVPTVTRNSYKFPLPIGHFKLPFLQQMTSFRMGTRAYHMQ